MDAVLMMQGMLNDVFIQAQQLAANMTVIINAAGSVAAGAKAVDINVLDILVHVFMGIGIALVAWMIMLLPRFQHPKPFDTLIKYRFAHRGLHSDVIPENSLSAFKAAMDAGYAAELDVMMSKDGKLFVMHDYSLKRMCGVDKKILDCTSDEIEKLHLADTDEKVPYFKDVLELVDGKMPLLIEVKATVKDCFSLMSKLFELLDNYKGDYCIESFDPRVLMWLKWFRPRVVRGQLSGFINKHGQKLFFLGDFALSFLLVNCVGSPDFIAYNYLDKKSPALTLCRSLYKPQTFYWTIKSEEDMKKVEADGSVIIFEDFIPPAK